MLTINEVLTKGNLSADEIDAALGFVSRLNAFLDQDPGVKDLNKQLQKMVAMRTMREKLAIGIPR